MALACACSVALTRAAGYVIEARADIADGLAGMTLAGLPDTARDRTRAAIINSGEPWPQRTITVGLSAASLPRYSSAFDTAVAVAVLAAAGAVAAAAAAGFGAVVVAAHDAAGDAPVSGIRVIPAEHLAALAAWLQQHAR